MMMVLKLALSPYHHVPESSHFWRALFLEPRFLPMLRIFQAESSWVKGDMLYTVGFHRLNLILLNGKRMNGKREYYHNRLGREQMKIIYQCVLHGLNLGNLGQYL